METLSGPAWVILILMGLACFILTGLLLQQEQFLMQELEEDKNDRNEQPG